VSTTSTAGADAACATMRTVLDEVRIRGLGVIDDAVLPLGPGLTVVTGETGAGKTMVVSGLGLLLGARGDAGAVRPGAHAAVVEGRVRLAEGSPVTQRVEEAGGQVDDGELLVVRSVSAEGRSRAHVGGRAVPVGLLGELAEHLVAVHGQSDQQRLLSPSAQREALDRFAGPDLAAELDRYRDAYRRLREVEAELDEVTTRARERAQELDLLRFGLEEIARVQPEPGEDRALRDEEGRLGHAESLREAARSAHALLAGDLDTAVDGGDATSLLAQAGRALAAVVGHDRELSALADRVAEASYLLADIAADLASYAESIDSDPARLAWVAQRRADLTALTRKYGEDADAVLAWAQRAAARAEELGGDDERRAALAEEREALRRRLGEDAERVSALRAHAGARFAEAVTTELAALAMPHARLEVAVDQRPQTGGITVGGRPVAFGPEGVDEVEIRLAAHAGAPARALQRGASGGELSRVMLAVEVVLAGADPVPTFVFDEVDAGVGGKAAVEIGRRLARLARTAQVLVVTHLPQVAAFADRHLVVVKSGDGTVTQSGVTLLEDTGRVRELSRMLAGLEESTTAAAHAEELLATAAAAKDEPARRPARARTRRSSA
jgi:DNA repair protein RecN (Recombination protein N)